ncbi:4'-phosphopantetheinyl transferase superfamily [Sporodiniella umbellata]|nr:4'-phosphopantetheinyl transferase superfamily [Sporodiniella umbellata]
MQERLELVCFNVVEEFKGNKFDQAIKKLTPEEAASVSRFKFLKDQHLALASILLRRHYFSNLLNVAWEELKFDKHPGGKPFLRNHKDIDFNISHEGNWVIFGCSKGLKVGVDVVDIVKPTTGSDENFILPFEPQLTGEELRLVMDSKDNKLSAFFEIWGCKESYIKAIGVGLYMELKKLNFKNENQQVSLYFEEKRLRSWRFYITYLDLSTVAVVCYGGDRGTPPELLKHATKLIGEPIFVDAHPFFKITLNDILK